MEQSRGPAIGIDLGTAYTRACVFDGNNCKILNDDNGNNQMPSYVAFTDDSGLLVGEAAKNQELWNPANTVFDIMRLIGRRYSDPSVQNDMKLWPFNVVRYPHDKAGVEVFWKGRVWQFSPEEILSMILTQVKENTEKIIQATIMDVVISIPVCFNYEQRHAVRCAGIIAGLNIMRLVGAPTAVGMFYSLRKIFARKSYTFSDILNNAGFSEECNMIIFDLGAGTFDVSVLTLKGDTCNVKATAGDVNFGGKDIDKNIVKHFIESLKDEGDITSLPTALIKLRTKCEKEKISLSIATKPTPNNDPNLGISITKAKFNELNKQHFLKCIDIMETCLKDAKMDRRVVHEVILAGGSTRIPLMQLYLRHFFGNEEINVSKHLEMAATFGASIQAFFLSGRKDPSVRDFFMSDVTPFSLGITLADGVMSVLVPKNTPIPTKKEKEFHSRRGNGTTFSTEVYEGEAKMTQQNNLLGKFELRDLSYSRETWKFNICFQVDVNGVLTVNAKEVYSKRKKGITITGDSSSAVPIEISQNRVREALLYREHSERNAYNASTKRISSQNDSTGMWAKLSEKSTLTQIRSFGKEKCENATGQSSNQITEPKQYAIGIDFGTTYSCVGVFLRRTGVKIVDNEYGNRLTRSCVAFTDAGRLIGDSVNKEQVTTNPGNTIYDIKRLIGRRCSDVAVQNDTKRLPYKIIPDNNGRPLISVQYKGVDKHFAPEEISSMILEKMKEIAEASLGSTVKKAVISVPSCFTDSQKKAIKDAGLIAGLEVMQLINEPTAAAIAFFLQKLGDESDIEKNVLVFDLGGGILEVSVFKISGATIEVQAVASDTNLGGENFDDNMVNHFAKQFYQRNKKDMSDKPKSLRRLRTACEKAKRILSTIAATLVEVDALYGGIDFRTNITKEDFEKINKSLFDRCIKCVEKCLKDAKMEKKQIHDIILVGGSSRIPKVQQLLQEFFDGKELCKGINQDEAIAYGASIQAAILSGNEDPKKFRGLKIKERTSLSLGVEIPGGAINVIIPKNTVIPKKEELTFTTSSDKLTEIWLNVHECESARDPEKFTISGILAEPRVFPKINVTFEIDANGILNVKAQQDDIMEEKSDLIVVTNNTCCLSAEEIEKMVEKAVGYKAEDEEHKKRDIARDTLERCAFKLQKLAKNPEIEILAPHALVWLEENQNATVDEINAQIKMLEGHKVAEFPN